MVAQPKDIPAKHLFYHDPSDSYFLEKDGFISGDGASVQVDGERTHERNAALFFGLSTYHGLLPHQYAKESEHSEQVALFIWAQICEQYDARLGALFAIPNGGSRGDTDMSRKIEGGKMKAEGVKSGVPDIMMPIPVGKNAGLFIEMKRKDGSEADVSSEQRRWINNLNGVGYLAVVCFGWLEAAEIIRMYLQIEME